MRTGGQGPTTRNRSAAEGKPRQGLEASREGPATVQREQQLGGATGAGRRRATEPRAGRSRSSSGTPRAQVRLTGVAVVAVGIDVGLLTGKGLDLVALDDSRQIVDTRSHIRDVEDIVRAVDALRPAVVCIDSPSQWVDAGTRRPAERELRRRGINLYATPSEERVRKFHHWMRDGMTVYAALASRYPRYTGGDVQGTAAEYYPHAACVVLAGHVPAFSDKVTVRRRLLAEHGVNEAAMHGPDQVDAALGALTGLIALEGGHCWVGEGTDAMLLPTRELLDRYARADAPEQPQQRMPATDARDRPNTDGCKATTPRPPQRAAGLREQEQPDCVTWNGDAGKRPRPVRLRAHLWSVRP